MTEALWLRCPDCHNGQERAVSVHDTLKTIAFECDDCGRVSRLRRDTAAARWFAQEEAGYREHMCRE